MDTSRLTLDHFLSRFQLLRPQMPHETLNQRQAAVLIPVVRRPQPGLLLTQRAIHLRNTPDRSPFPAGRGQYRCFAYRRSASRSAGGSRHPAASRGSDWRFTAGNSVTGFQVTPGGRHYSAKSPLARQ
ncbi:putative nudix hydrolase YeaB [Salmonella enterica subsp. enterica]|uniref:Putative nudix hydrolase YeaB n=1 Tax=Salmonella enterica I TaxID=59201 RepID=A0A379WUC5_SALET|nr:putative nudix hydrolase YeaB [Salmonella enterica subsp. enterica]